MENEVEQEIEFVKLNKYPELAFHGETFEDFYRPKKLATRPGKGNHKKKLVKIYESGIASWIKQLFLIDSFVRNEDNDHRPYFVSTKSQLRTLNGFGNDYSLRTIQDNLVKLEKMGFIKILPFPASEEELKVNPKNHHLNRRKLLPDLEKINKFISVFDEDDQILKDLPKRDPRKKLIRQRPYSYIGLKGRVAEAKYKEYTEPKQGVQRRKPYRNPKEMLIYWARKVSSRYYNVDGLTRKFIPTSLDDIQEVVDKASILRASSKGIVDEDTVRCYQDNIDHLTDEEAAVLIGWKAPPKFMRRLEYIGYTVSKGVITAFRRREKEICSSSSKPSKEGLEAFKSWYSSLRTFK